MKNGLSVAAVAGMAFFVVMLAGIVSLELTQPTVALLGGALIGIMVGMPTTVLIFYLAITPRNNGQVKTPPAQPEPRQLTPPAQHTHYHTHNTVNVYTSRAPQSMSPFQICSEVATALRISRHEAERMIEAGEVKLLPPPDGRN